MKNCHASIMGARTGSRFFGMTGRRRGMVVALAVWGAMGGAGVVRQAGADTLWIGNPSVVGNWFDLTNWFGGIPVGSNAEIDNGATAQMNTSGATVLSLYLGKGVGQSGYVTITGGNGLVKVTASEYVGYSGMGAILQATGSNTLSGSVNIYIYCITQGAAARMDSAGDP